MNCNHVRRKPFPSAVIRCARQGASPRLAGQNAKYMESQLDKFRKVIVDMRPR